MKLAAHITFFYVEERLIYLNEVIEGLSSLNADVDIYIYTNRHFNIDTEQDSSIYLKIFPYSAKGIKFHYNSLFGKLGLKQWIHPYHLSWECRKVIQDKADDYDVQIYLEDDIAFTQENLDYWLKFKGTLIENDYNLGFLRIEEEGDQCLITDLSAPLTNICRIENETYLINDNNPYCGFWIYDKKELKKFIETKEWQFKFKEYFTREKSAIGWHGDQMNHYKKTLIPLIKEGSNWQTPKGASVHHIPNNYLGHPIFCKVEFPIKLPAKLNNHE